jgi:hypothetical protein
VKAAGFCVTLYSRVSVLCMNINAACIIEYVFTLVGIVCYGQCSVFISREYADHIWKSPVSVKCLLLNIFVHNCLWASKNVPNVTSNIKRGTANVHEI